MASIVVLGAGIGGVSAAYQIRPDLDSTHTKPLYEKYILRLLGIERLKDSKKWRRLAPIPQPDPTLGDFP